MVCFFFQKPPGAQSEGLAELEKRLKQQYQQMLAKREKEWEQQLSSKDVELASLKHRVEELG